MTFFFVHTGVEIAIGEVRKLLRIGGVGTLTFVVLAVAGGLFGLHGSERRDELFVLSMCWWLVEVLLYVHRNRRFIRDGSPGRPSRLSYSS